MTLEIDTALQILKPPALVSEAIRDHRKMSGYFIKDSSGPLESGKTVEWSFPEFEGSFPVRTDRVEEDYISWYWDGENGKEFKVEILLKDCPGGTLVTVREGKAEADEEGIKWLKNNTAGWANFLACLKAYLEYNINLRKGAFDFMSEPPSGN